MWGLGWDQILVKDFNTAQVALTSPWPSRFEQEGVLPQQVDLLVMLFLAFVCEVVAMPAAEVFSSWREVKRPDSPFAWLSVSDQQAYEPIPVPSERARGSGQVNAAV